MAAAGSPRPAPAPPPPLNIHLLLPFLAPHSTACESHFVCVVACGQSHAAGLFHSAPLSNGPGALQAYKLSCPNHKAK